MTFRVYEKSRWKGEPRNLELARDRNTEEGNTENVNGYARPSIENKWHKEQS